MNTLIKAGILLLGLAAFSCQSAHQSNFSQVPVRVQNRMVPYAPGPRPDTLVQGLTGADVRALCRQHAYTWVVVWAPWCQARLPYVAQYKQLQQQLAARDVNLVFVDVLYSPRTALGLNDELRGHRPAYVINWRHYGDGADYKFRQDLAGPQRLPRKLRYSDHFVFNQQQELLQCTNSEMPA